MKYKDNYTLVLGGQLRLGVLQELSVIEPLLKSGISSLHLLRQRRRRRGKSFGLSSLWTACNRLNELFSCLGWREETRCPCCTNWTGKEGTHSQQEGFLLRTHLPLYHQFWPQAFNHSFPKSELSPTGQFHCCLGNSQSEWLKCS